MTVSNMTIIISAHSRKEWLRLEVWRSWRPRIASEKSARTINKCLKTEGKAEIPQHLCRGPSHRSASPFYRAILPVPDSAFTHTHIHTHTHTYGFHKYIHTHTHTSEYMNIYTPYICVCCVCGSFHKCLSNNYKVVSEKGIWQCIFRVTNVHTLW